MANLTNILDHTNARLNNWYINAKADYGVTGSANASYNAENETIEIRYTENGVTGLFTLGGFENEAIDWVFNVWGEMADLEEDRISA